MRILFMADVPPDPDSGAAGTELRTIEALRVQGHEVDAIWASELGRRIGHGNLHYLLELPRAYRRALKRALKQNRYDVVHVNQPHGYLAAAALQGTQTVFVHRSHGLELRVEEELRPWRKRFGSSPNPLRRAASAAMQQMLARHSNQIARLADGHIVSSSGCGEFLEKRMEVPPSKIAVIPQGVTPSLLHTPAPPMTLERLSRLLYVGQFAFVKAPMVVAEAMSRLLLQDPRWEATWVCSRQDHGEVRRLINPDVRDRVRLLDWIPADSLRQVYDQHGVFLFLSFFEGFGKAFLEAMSRGMCVVATDVGGAHDIIDPGENGILVPPGNPEAAAAAARSLLSDRVFASRISQRGAASARSYTWDRTGRATAEFYRSLLDARSRGTL